MTVQENIDAVETALHAVEKHCMCAHFVEDRTHYTVCYPEGMYPNGARVSQGMGKAKALSRLLEVMERHWQENSIR
jgi:hypothetical protein